jgi:hypothetical protein
LLQTGKAQPAPVVLLDTPGGTYWTTWLAFVREELLDTGYIGEHDLALLCATDNVDDAVDEIVSFYGNYDSLRFVDGRLVLRVREVPDAEALAGINEEFADIVVRDVIEPIDATRAEVADGDHLEFARLAFWFDRRGWARLRMLIDAINAPGR